MQKVNTLGKVNAICGFFLFLDISKSNPQIFNVYFPT